MVLIGSCVVSSVSLSLRVLRTSSPSVYSDVQFVALFGIPSAFLRVFSKCRCTKGLRLFRWCVPILVPVAISSNQTLRLVSVLPETLNGPLHLISRLRPHCASITQCLSRTISSSLISGPFGCVRRICVLAILCC